MLPGQPKEAGAKPGAGHGGNALEDARGKAVVDDEAGSWWGVLVPAGEWERPLRQFDAADGAGGGGEEAGGESLEFFAEVSQGEVE